MSNVPDCQVSYRSSIKLFNAISTTSMILSVILFACYASPPALEWHRDQPYDAQKHYCILGIVHIVVFGILLLLTPRCNCDFDSFDDDSVDYCDDSDLMDGGLAFLLVFSFIWLFQAYKTQKAVLERKRNTPGSDNVELAAIGALEGYAAFA